MAFLAINGIEIPVREGTLGEESRDIGERAQAFDGTLRMSRLAQKLDLAFDTPVMTDGASWYGLLTGQGEKWSFDSSVYGSKGSPPSAATSAAVSATRSKFGGKSLKLTATTGDVTFTQNTDTAAFWHWNGAAWDHYVYNTAGVIHKNGVSPASGPTGVTVTVNGTAVRFQAGGGDVFLDDLVITPYGWVSTWQATVYAAGAAFGLTPQLAVTGDAIIAGSPRIMLGVVSFDFVKAVLGGSFRTNARILHVKLTAV